MCLSIEVTLPTLETFLLLYSLRCGSACICVWTIFRTLFCVIFYTVAILEVLIHESSPFGFWLANANYRVPGNLATTLFYCYMVLTISGVVLLVFTSFLGYGIYFEKSNLLKYYLICRFVTWVIEVLFTIVLCFCHIFLIGYYLCILLFIVLEFYSFNVVYSYYVTVYEQERDAYKDETPRGAQELHEHNSFPD